MDFHSLLRRDLQFLCKRNKIPANITNVGMADALKALEIVEGLDEYMNQSDAPFSPTTVTKQPMTTATKTTRRKTSMKAETQSSSSQLTCQKSLVGEMEQEKETDNVIFEASVAKTPAVRTTRRASVATSCKNDEIVQSAYTTRRSTRLLEKCMAELSLNTNKKPVKNEETELKVSSEEAEVVPSRDLSASMEKEWDNNLKNDSDQEIAVSDTNTETNDDKMNEDEKESEDSLVKVDKEEEEEEDEILEDVNEHEVEELLQAMSSVLGHANIESKDVLTSESSVTENAIQEKEPEKVEDTMLDSDARDDSETETEGGDSDSNVSEAKKIEDTMLDQSDSDAGDDSETETEGVDSDGNVSEADSAYKTYLESDMSADNEMTFLESEGSAAAQFPSPVKVVVNEDKENNMEMMNVCNEESKVEVKQKVKIDEDKLKDTSMRQLVKMVKELAIKNNRTALDILPGDNQIAE